MNACIAAIVTALFTIGCASQVVDDSRVPGPDEERSTLRLSTYLLFDGDCRQAMEFYRSVLGGELTMTTVGESPMKSAFPVGMHSKVLHARLQGPWVDISASDWLRVGQERTRGNAISLYIRGGTPGETAALFQALAQGAEITDAFSEQPFGLYGSLNDKFGVRWRFHSASTSSGR